MVAEVSDCSLGVDKSAYFRKASFLNGVHQIE